MAQAKWGRDKHGRVFWYDAATGRRLKPPQATDRPRLYRVDKRGRGYWLWGDTGLRAPKPAWNAAPQYDRAGRPRDSAGRLVPKRALLPEPAVWPEAPAPKPTRKKGPRVRPRIPRRVRLQMRRGDEPIPGFATPRGYYVTKPTESPPRDLDVIFRSWLKGAVRRSALASASEIGFRQHGVVFVVQAPLDRTAMAELAGQLAGQPVRLVFRAVARNEWEIWMHSNLPDRRTGEIEQKGYRGVANAFSGVEAAANIIWDFLYDWDADFAWHEYIETEDDIYEGGE